MLVALTSLGWLPTDDCLGALSGPDRHMQAAMARWVMLRHMVMAACEL